MLLMNRHVGLCMRGTCSVTNRDLFFFSFLNELGAPTTANLSYYKKWRTYEPSAAAMADAMAHEPVHLTKWVNALACMLIWHEKMNTVVPRRHTEN